LAAILEGSVKAIMTIMAYLVSNTSPALTTAEYDSIAACERARPAIVQAFTVNGIHPVVLCTAKG
jgi:hypothetical protein